MVIRVGSSPILHTKNSPDTFASGLFFCYVKKARWDLNRERANIFACSPIGEKTVQWTVLRVWSPQSESPILHTKKSPDTFVSGLFFLLC